MPQELALRFVGAIKLYLYLNTQNGFCQALIFSLLGIFLIFFFFSVGLPSAHGLLVRFPLNYRATLCVSQCAYKISFLYDGVRLEWLRRSLTK